mgnify:CR=1 FL=1
MIYTKNEYADQFDLNTTDNYNSLFNFKLIDREKSKEIKNKI